MAGLEKAKMDYNWEMCESHGHWGISATEEESEDSHGKAGGFPRTIQLASVYMLPAPDNCVIIFCWEYSLNLCFQDNFCARKISFNPWKADVSLPKGR